MGMCGHCTFETHSKTTGHFPPSISASMVGIVILDSRRRRSTERRCVEDVSRGLQRTWDLKLCLCFLDRRGHRIHCVHAGPRASHPIFGGKRGHDIDAYFGKPDSAAGGSSSELEKLHIAWPEAALPCLRRVMVVPCFRRLASRCRGSWRPPAFLTELSCMAHTREGIFLAGRQTRRLSLCRN